jgi:hypothetical protein
MSHNSLMFLDKRHRSARLLINKAPYGQGLQSAEEQLTGRDKQAKKYTEMKPSLKRSPCHAHKLLGEEEELEKTPQRKPMPPSTTQANHVHRPFHL